ncbi:MAG: YbhB/YbcL family Raf kinase inhibitor-like protein [Nitrososphaerota archaeon]|jgi:Raf kinase inhibitor-like YbhB/YbcL family protein|nr:YbhB/YbcL family Raf kinase inhibitor-like protein [Nitrososphaerota archaeon]MDG6927637.1 YbhB/YbcL family Raf kinase inhibitor-like protein [Nitrososphaerota archaeon]MDG6931380.1 YbhB/YbcL family Raf kinase inhibitor-like protein [Nitrososphaerota archaeon]MDG6931590.1 YbhB/YbcL family Raf kinase inhibitor-like protein [Nitrososphaerota archaeon]MDG6935993.1 YbhB/YbcL family Raf kinase inhibitor-like protein [Nitrososphaerota archaeon]
MNILKASFENGARIARKHTCEGENVSPSISWSRVNGALTYAIIAEDPDAPGGTFVHWVIYNLVDTQVQEGIKPNSSIGVQGKNDFGKTGYGGPCPPRGNGSHRYFFKIYALNGTLPIMNGISAPKLRELMKNKILDSGEIMGTYSRD